MTLSLLFKFRKISICFVSARNIHKCEAIHSGLKNNKLEKKNNKTDQSWKNYELTSTLKISKQSKDSVIKMNIMLRKQERTARHKSNKNIMRLWLRKLHDLYNSVCTTFCFYSRLQSWIIQGCLKDTKHPRVRNQCRPC